MSRLKAIYEPKGRAREYADLAVNLFRTCYHACEYCYSPKVMHIKPEEFFKPPIPRDGIIPKIRSDARQLRARDERREILLSFTCDIYQPTCGDHQVAYTTRAAIKSLLDENLNIAILTKGGARSLADVDLIEQHPNQVRYGTTLVFDSDRDSMKFEPQAAPTSERIVTLEAVHTRGIRTWVSIEPAWSIQDTLNIIDRTRRFTDTYMIGKLNYHPHAAEVDWAEYTQQVVDKLQHLNKQFYLKQDLRRYIHLHPQLIAEMAKIRPGV
jgi:DNA repair photolyase